MEAEQPRVSSPSQSRSFVGNVIEFEVIEDPPWRNREGENFPSISEMVREIVKMQEQWASAKEKLDPESLEKVERYFLSRFIYHVNTEEDHGCQGSVEEVDECLNSKKHHKTLQEQETINIYEAYSYLKRVVDEEEKSLRKEGHESLRGFLELDLFKEIHKIILGNLPMGKCKTPPGQLSRNRRFTEYKGKKYDYQKPQDMENAVWTLLDQYNSLVDSLKDEEKSKEIRVFELFKICSWFIFEMLDLHPFGDGNGRLCRLLCSYLLSKMTPFPTSIYNIWSSSSKEDYVQALVDTREKYERKPKSLAAMIVECNWCGWKEFMRKIECRSE